MQDIKSQEGSAAGAQPVESPGTSPGASLGASLGESPGESPGRSRGVTKYEKRLSELQATNTMNIGILKPGMPEILKSTFWRRSSFELVSLECWGNTSNNGRRAG